MEQSIAYRGLLSERLFQSPFSRFQTDAKADNFRLGWPGLVPIETRHQIIKITLSQPACVFTVVHEKNNVGALTFEFLLNPGRGRLIRTARIENRDDASLRQVHILPAIKCNQSIAHLSRVGRGEECSHSFLKRCLV